ncbi:MAG TPA: hypothetical protein DHU63_02515 [Candidatus Marinimicrobia bacterium]|nr:MAG: hypothetical protein AUJ47_11975 [Candidatus Marinimicrobia bacterium CG1_02_48_14]PIZ63254.1 MAG: hypothetical protein COY19_10400 [Candidatus Marinimicrobia bacterium CG_4_10_14_0_2_um_filter_48_9]PJA54742.1 MAG: hypothetical protein CO167_02135 [Candidatus Marinimicrobia bacterium CG_4_9_14_3_um_filter_48_9]HCW75394.1 hypothetical protein [Candidatus Neomarinimicrobiota bacterium]
MISKELIQILRCPESHQTLILASDEFLETQNQKIGKRELKNLAGEIIDKELTAGLLRKDGKILYPIIDEIPVLLIDQGIVLE